VVYVITWITRVATIKWQTNVAVSRKCGPVYSRSVCDTSVLEMISQLLYNTLCKSTFSSVQQYGPSLVRLTICR